MLTFHKTSSFNVFQINRSIIHFDLTLSRSWSCRVNFNNNKFISISLGLWQKKTQFLRFCIFSSMLNDTDFGRDLFILRNVLKRKLAFFRQMHNCNAINNNLNKTLEFQLISMKYLGVWCCCSLVWILGLSSRQSEANPVSFELWMKFSRHHIYLSFDSCLDLINQTASKLEYLPFSTKMQHLS